jgi:DNA-binding NtrC family response regulator
MDRVLVFDDDSQICDVLELALSQMDLEVIPVRSAEHAREAIDGGLIVVALIDTPMFKFSGIELGTYAQARGIKVLMMAAGEDAALRVEAAGFPCLVKPFHVLQLADAMAKLLGHAAHQEPGATPE